MAKSKELDILANLFNKLSDEEKQELLDLATDNKPNKKEPVNHFLNMDLPEETKYRNASKKLTKTAKNTNKSHRKETKMVEVSCKNCGKKFTLPENYPNIRNFICCI